MLTLPPRQLRSSSSKEIKQPSAQQLFNQVRKTIIEATASLELEYQNIEPASGLQVALSLDGDYYSSFGTKTAIDKMAKGDTERGVVGVWNAILTRTFPDSQGYIVRPQYTVGSGDITDLFVLQYWAAGNQTRETQFLAVQCKRPDACGKHPVWNDAGDQLVEYPKGLSPRNVAASSGSSPGMVGAAAACH
jgi:hypothetical protein